MEVIRCSRCGAFYTNGGYVCPKCTDKDNFELSTFKNFVENNLFKNSNVFNDETFELLLNEYNVFLDNAIKYGAKVYKGVNVNIKLLKEKLSENNLIMLAGKIDNIYHSILLSEYVDNRFIVHDPLDKDKKIMSYNEINNYMNTNIGKWFIIINDKS